VPIRTIRGQTPSTQAETHIKTKIDNISFQQTLSKSQALSNSNKDNLFYKIAQSSEFSQSLSETTDKSHFNSAFA